MVDTTFVSLTEENLHLFYIEINTYITFVSHKSQTTSWISINNESKICRCKWRPYCRFYTFHETLHDANENPHKFRLLNYDMHHESFNFLHYGQINQYGIWPCDTYPRLDMNPMTKNKMNRSAVKTCSVVWYNKQR